MGGTPGIDLGEAGLILLIVILSPFSPTIGGFLITALTLGRTGVRDLWRRLWNRNLTIPWLLAIPLFYPVLLLITRNLAQLINGIPQAPFELLSKP